LYFVIPQTMETKVSLQKIVRTRIISIYWLPGEGKTFFASFLAWFYDRIYSNVDFFRNWKKINQTLKSMLDIEKIEFNEQRGLLVIDEAWSNVNARRAASERNLIFGKLWMYCRKKNVNIVIISQLERMSDVYFRELSYYHFEISSFYSWYEYLMFNVSIKNRHGFLVKNMLYDLIKYSNKYKITYNTLDYSLIE